MENENNKWEEGFKAQEKDVVTAGCVAVSAVVAAAIASQG